MLFDSFILIQIPLSVHSCYNSRYHNLWSKECLVRTTGCPREYPTHLASKGDHLESSQIALTGCLVFMLTFLMFHYVLYVFTYRLMPHNMKMLYFLYLISKSQIVHYVLQSTQAFSFYRDVILTLSTVAYFELSDLSMNEQLVKMALWYAIIANC